MKLRLLDLFSGIGGFSLGLERSGNFETSAFCEIEPYCRAVLKKHWPNVTVYEDVKELSKERLAADGLAIDAICGGFPCQDISTAGRGAGLAGERSGLWFEFHRLIKEIKPQVAIIENVSALRSRGLDEVLRSLAEIGYDAEWHCIPASAVGAHHQRDRIWIMAYPTRHNAKEMGYPAEYTRNTLGLGTVILKPHLWPTPTTSSGGPNHQSAAVNERGHGINLAGAVQKWPTPQASDHRDRGCMEDPSIQRRIKLGKQIGLSTVVKEHRECGTLNPTWVEWLMGFPIEWTVLEHWVMRSSRKSRK